MIALADAAADDAQLIPPEIHDLYNKDIAKRKLERQLRVLPDLLNRCPDIASKVTRVHTLANTLATAPLAFSMFSEVDKLARIYLTIPVTTATVERSFSDLQCIKTYLRSTMSQQRLNNIMLLNVHKDLADGLDMPTIPRQFVDANERRRRFFGTMNSPQSNPPERLGLILGTVRLELFGNLTTCILLYYTILYYTILYYTILYYTILYYTILYYTILY